MLHIHQVKYLYDYQIWVEFDNHISGQIDLLPELWGDMFEPLKNKTLFATVKVDPVLKTITWENGADLAPEFLFQLLQQQKLNYGNYYLA